MPSYVFDHHQVAERALLIWKEDSIKLCLEVFGDKCWSTVYSTLKKMTEKYWLIEIRQITKTVIADLQSTNPEFFKSSTVSKVYKMERIRKFDEKSKEKLLNFLCILIILLYYTLCIYLGKRMSMEKSETISSPSNK